MNTTVPVLDQYTLSDDKEECVFLRKELHRKNLEKDGR